MAEALHVERVSKTFPNGAVALDNVSLVAEAEGFLVLLGPSGSGKTTLLRSVAGIERISAGRIAIGERVVADDRLHIVPERRRLSMVFQDYALWPHLSVIENVAFALKRHRASSSDRRQQATAMLERVGLGHLSERYPSELSGGEQQRVALGRALVGDAGLVLFDEPLSNLDADLRDRMRVEISELVRESGATTVYITHDQSEAFALADHIGVLEHGRLVQLDTPENVYSRPVSPFVARFTGVAAEIPVRILSGSGPGPLVEVELIGVPGARSVAAEAIGPVTAGAALLLIRPAAVGVVAPGSDSRHVAGTVTDVAFRGRGYELAVELHGGTRVTNVMAERRLTRGEAIGLQFGPGGCVVFAQGEAEPELTDEVRGEPDRPASAGAFDPSPLPATTLVRGTAPLPTYGDG